MLHDKLYIRGGVGGKKDVTNLVKREDIYIYIYIMD